MARIVYCHPSLTKHAYHVFTDLDFWDARRLLFGLAVVKRNFASKVSGDDYPTQVVGDFLSPATIRTIEKRIRQAIASPARHVIVRSMVTDGYFEFDPLRYYPERWSRSRMLYFTNQRLPHTQGVVSNPYQTAHLTWVDDRIRLDRVQRAEKFDPVIRTVREARRSFAVPTCF
ncbi:MAG: hypothetical protein AB9873_18545 [Syntrophobacteraceae bacterium]